MKWPKPKRLADCHNVLDLRELAMRRVPAPIFHIMDGAAETESTARANTAAFGADRLIPKCLVDVSSVATRTRVLGQELEWPVFCSPTGGTRFFHPDGEKAVARAVAQSGTLYGVSMMSTFGLEEIAAASSGPKMLQLYPFKNRDVMRDMVARCRQSGYAALCLTVDAPVRGNHERELRSGMSISLQLSPRSIAQFARHPRWSLGQARRGPLSMRNIAKWAGSDSLAAQSRYILEQVDPSFAWKDVREIVELWGGPFALKGVLSADDARRAADAGATAVIVSNHGGRQLDGAVATIEALPEIARAVGHRVDVILDGGIRRGAHVLKALARGAKACSIGRPYLFGLAAGGERGVDRALNILRTELVRAMKLCGCTDASAVDEKILRRF